MFPHQSMSAGPGWQRELAAAFTSTDELLRYLELDPGQADDWAGAARSFPVRVPRGFAARMRKGDPRDPLLLQVLPQGQEVDARIQSGYSLDPVGDGESESLPGLLRKYSGRALLMAGPTCAIHCRYCFRRHYPYAESSLFSRHWDAAMEILRRDDSLREIILSGGDPLTLSDTRLGDLIGALEPIAHVRRLRLHSRLPVVLPSRVTPELVRLLARSRWRTIMVIHANHPRELDAEVASALTTLRQAGIALLNQAVLLHGVNDQPEVLESLSERLFECGVLPYYLHQLDRVWGAAHFAVSEERALALHHRLSARLPGYLVPRLVREIPGAPAKIPLGSIAPTDWNRPETDG